MSSAPKEVFISYARRSPGKYAGLLRGELGHRAFLDTQSIRLGDNFRREIGEALLNARVVVLFADEHYFESPNCRAEFQLATCVGGDAGYPQVVVALEGGGVVRSLPPELQGQNWPAQPDVAGTVQLVEQRLALCDKTVRERDPARADAMLHEVTTKWQMPLPGRLSGIPHCGMPDIPESIGDRFVGREDEIRNLHIRLDVPRASAAIRGGLGGAPGFGKTRLAIEYLRRFGPLVYDGGIFWLNAESGEPELQLHAMLQELDPNAPPLAELQQQGVLHRVLLRAFEKAGTGKRILFVADNVPEGDSRPLTHWCPRADCVTLLVTSRGAIDGLDAPVIVGELPPDAAVQLLTRDLDTSRTNPASWNAICEWVGRQSLALEILNSALRHQAATLPELLAARDSSAVDAVDVHLMALKESGVSGLVQRGIKEAVRISYEKLSLESRRAAHLIARLAGEPVPMVVMRKLVPEERLGTIRTVLRSRHWITGDARADGEKFGRMHRVLADFLRSSNASPEAEGEEWLAVCLALNAVLNPGASRDPSRWHELNACLSHADHLFDSIVLSHGVLSISNWSAVVRLGIRIGILRWAQGLSSAARDRAEVTVALSVKSLGEEHRDTLDSMDNLATIRHAQGDFAGARELQEKVLTISSRVLGPDIQTP